MSHRSPSTRHRLRERLLRGFSRRRLAFLCALSVALLALNGLIFYQSVRTIVDHDQAVRHSQDVLSALENLLTSLDDAETGERGYIITGDRSYLQPYSAALGRIDPQIARLASLTAGDARQQDSVQSLRVLVAAKLSELQLGISNVQRATDPVARFTLSDQDRYLMDQLRALIASMKSDALATLDARSAQARSATDAALAGLIIATVAGMALIAGIFALIWRDIARRARAMEEREQLLRNEQAARIAAEEAVQARETFLSLASHELKTPLTSLLGNAQLLQRSLAHLESLSERDRSKVASILRQGQRLRALTEQLLDTSRLQHGQLAIEREPLDIVALVRRVVEEEQAIAHVHVFELRAPDEPLMVLGDALRLEQVLHNLLGNAVKYSPQSDRVLVEVSLEGDEVRIAVTDFGIGIPEAAQSQLFERFYRAANVGAAGGTISGLGIGLYVVKEVVSRHDGRVEAVSAEGAGSTFSVYLPLCQAAVAPAAIDA